jgi:glycosyltransferase involved in cell wall biosynthesis
MKIALDARFFGPEGTGIGKYVEKLLENLEQLDSKNKYYIILRKSNFPLYNPKNANFEKVLADAHWYGVKEQILLPAVLTKIKPDLVHFPHFNIPLLYPGRFVVTVHDITKSEFKDASFTTRALPIYYLKHLGYEVTIRQAVRRAKKVLTPSNASKKKLTRAFGLSSEKIVVTYEAADDIFTQAGKEEVSEGRKKQVLATYGIKPPFILYVGNAFPYKNLDNLLAALKLLDKEISLVYAASRNFFVNRLLKRAKEVGVEERLVLTGFVPNEDLAILYKLTECFVFPSLSEGFGLPGVEAMAAGCPVVCSNIPVFKEVYGDAAVYFDPKKPKEIAKAIELIINNSELRIKMRKAGFEQARKYSWRTLAEQTLHVYESVASDSKGY